MFFLARAERQRGGGGLAVEPHEQHGVWHGDGRRPAGDLGPGGVHAQAHPRVQHPGRQALHHPLPRVLAHRALRRRQRR
eukprot:2997778-Pyramimonas_sp.AAC.1